MGIEALFLSVSVFWVVVHGLHQWWSHGASRPILPLASDQLNTHRKLYPSRLVLYRLSLRVEYTGINRVHENLSWRLAGRKHARSSRYLTFFYDLGSLLGLLGFLSAVFVLLLLTAKLCYGALLFSRQELVHGGSTLSKRDAVAEISPPTSGFQRDNSLVHLLVPGLTVPLSHMIPLLLALFTCQVIHEAGHAITALIDSVPLLSVGASLTIIIPSAFVSLSSAGMQKLPARARLRIISAGAMHNLVFWAVLAALSSLSLESSLWSLAGYTNVGHFARTITWINPESPLSSYLPLGALVTHLNDEALISSAEDVWTKYLSEAKHPDQSGDLGWCTYTSWFDAQPTECCTSHTHDTGLSCFQSTHSPLSPSLHKCLHPHSFFNEASQRCHDTTHCGGSHVCVRPSFDEDILRIRLWIPAHLLVEGQKQEETVVWSGPWEEVLEDVEVGMYVSRYRFLPLGFPSLVDVFFRYLSSLTLSLFFFNLLPLPFLDGGQFLDALFDLLVSRTLVTTLDEVELDSLEAGVYSAPTSSFTTLRWKRRTLNGAAYAVGGLMGLCGLAGFWSYVR